MTKHENEQFIQELWGHFNRQGRHELPWRMPQADGTFDPYAILVSELMLQQTQVQRVIPKFLQFMQRFPTVAALAEAPLADVLIMWSGLGYNRRAKFLHASAQKVLHDFGGLIPRTMIELQQLPGVGTNTAGAIMAYAYNTPVPFIETNVRTVYIHHFFHDSTAVQDKAILQLLDKTLDRENARLFYWALMDYGMFLKQTHGNLNKLSVGYAKQSKFQGSLREIRGKVIRELIRSPLTRAVLDDRIADARLAAVLESLVAEGLIRLHDGTYSL